MGATRTARQAETRPDRLMPIYDREMRRRREKKRMYDILTGDETWLCNYDPETKRHRRYAWWLENEPTPRKCRHARNIQKQRVATFFCKTGHIATLVLEVKKQLILSGMWHCAPAVLSAWCDKRPNLRNRHLLWHHDNAALHTAARGLVLF
ncbi:hypothetical protein EVAR_22560_1 [Eumeta japonica]|uniref:Mariner Mos1 transposase n=1 Tax=Eumeta variegata TaxID=151549 RepID=A0A4C1U8M3_EUMVA|nr:hypothetical protein EVAR_22560_1 [Eumeta japonica]